MKHLLSLLFIFAFISGVWAQDQKPLVVFLVRHAEKVDQSRDPDLSVEGKERAKTLAETLKSAKIEHVYSTDYVRTKNTAAPVSYLFGLETQIYNPRDLSAFAKELLKTGGRCLVVGHSNTTPELVKLLGGEPGVAINEKKEYDRIYIVTKTKNEDVSSVLLRYGKKFSAE